MPKKLPQSPSTPAADKPVPSPEPNTMTLAIDIGGTGLKATVIDLTGKMMHNRVRVPTPVKEPPSALIGALVEMTRELPSFERISAGYPGAVRDGRVLTAPHFSDPAWVGFDLASALGEAFGKPVRVSNDADIQGLGVIAGRGIEFVLTLGTGAGTAAFKDGVIGPHLEFAHHPVHGKKTYNDYIGNEALKKIGAKRWNKRLHKVIEILQSLVHYDRLYIGGGNSSEVHTDLPANVTLVSNDAGLTGGIALWQRGVPQ